MSNTFTVYSSHGSVIACKKTGCVLSVNAGYYEDVREYFCGEMYTIKYNCLEDIIRFFTAEYIAFYGELHDDIDILNIGFWETDYEYTPPEEDRRNYLDYVNK